jgi:hypothetical protein
MKGKYEINSSQNFCYIKFVTKLHSFSDRMVNECGRVDGVGTDKGNRCTRRKPASAPLCPRLSDLGSNVAHLGGADD